MLWWNQIIEMSRIICFLNFVSIVFLSKVTGIFMQQSLYFFVLLNSDFSCDLSERTNENIFGSN